MTEQPRRPPHPTQQLLELITTEFKRIKRKQAALLGLTSKAPNGSADAEDERREAERLDPSPPPPPAKARL